MSDLNAFIAKCKSDPAVAAQMKGAMNSTTAAAVAKANGFNVTAAELDAHKNPAVDDAALEAAAGGGGCIIVTWD